jgi:flagellar basal body-associated protein FliL
MSTPSDPPPQYEPGGDRIMIVIVLIVVTALGGMAWSFFSRQNAPAGTPEIKSRHLPPSERPAPDKASAPAAVAPAPTPAPAK